MDSYAFDAAWEKERDRLHALEAVFDHAMTRHLADLGTGTGRRCLEVGCGADGVALWLARRAGATGRVLATFPLTTVSAGAAGQHRPDQMAAPRCRRHTERRPR